MKPTTPPLPANKSNDRKTVNVPSVADCEAKWQEYWRKHGHEGSASYEQKRQAFFNAYWQSTEVL